MFKMHEFVNINCFACSVPNVLESSNCIVQLSVVVQQKLSNKSDDRNDVSTTLHFIDCSGPKTEDCFNQLPHVAPKSCCSEQNLWLHGHCILQSHLHAMLLKKIELTLHGYDICAGPLALW